MCACVRTCVFLCCNGKNCLEFYCLNKSIIRYRMDVHAFIWFVPFWLVSLLWTIRIIMTIVGFSCVCEDMVCMTGHSNKNAFIFLFSIFKCIWFWKCQRHIIHVQVYSWYSHTHTYTIAWYIKMRTYLWIENVDWTAINGISGNLLPLQIFNISFHRFWWTRATLRQCFWVETTAKCHKLKNESKSSENYPENGHFYVR